MLNLQQRSQTNSQNFTLKVSANVNSPRTRSKTSRTLTVRAFVYSSYSSCERTINDRKFATAISNTSTSASGVTKTYIRANYIESNLEEDIDRKNQFKLVNLSNPTLIQDPATKYYVESKTLDLVTNSEFDNTTIVRTNKSINFNGNTILGCESVYVNRDPSFYLEVSTKQYTDTLIGESSKFL